MVHAVTFPSRRGTRPLRPSAHPADLSQAIQVVLPSEHQTATAVSTKLTPLQRQVFDLLGVDPNQTVPITVTG